MVAIPRPQAALADRAGYPTNEWYTYFLQLRDFAGLSESQVEQLNQLAARIAELENAAGSGGFQIMGVGSVQVFGTPAGGIIQIYLEGDVDQPGASWYYGTGPDGTRSWFALADAFEVTADLTKAVDADTGVTTFGVADLADTGAGAALVRITRDAKGRVAGTQAATTTDLAEGTNLYFTNARVDARIAAQKGQPNGITPLGPDSLIPTQYLPPLAITETYVVGSQAAQLALDAQEGDVAVRTDLSKNFIHNGGTSGTMSDWTELLTPAAPVQSVNGQTGNVVLTAANVGAATAAQGAKADTAVQEVRPGTGVTVDNTDPLRPIVSATPVASGVPEAPNDALIYARGSLDWQPLTGPQSRYHLLQYPLLTDQLGNQLTDQLGRPLWSNAPQVPYSWLTGVPANLAAIAPLTGSGWLYRSPAGVWSLVSEPVKPVYPLTALPPVTPFPREIYVSGTSGVSGVIPAYSDGTAWLRYSDNTPVN